MQTILLYLYVAALHLLLLVFCNAEYISFDGRYAAKQLKEFQ